MNEEEGKHKNKKKKIWNTEKTTRPTRGGGERKKINGYRQENITKGV